ncbi:MAG: ATP-binding protein, partial [Solirubrobacteraceae bacterium]
IEVNGVALSPWDPFAREEPRTQRLPGQDLEAGEGPEVLTVGVRPYVLPSQQAFSSPDAHRRAAGPNRWNRHQGFYIYRRDRLIQAGGWNRLRTLDEHAKLARIALDLPVGHEEHFAVDVAKMRVTIPEELRPGLRAIAAAAVAVAQERYRDHLESGAADTRTPVVMSAEAISISRDWPAIMRAVEDVVGDDVQLRDRLLLRLANADPDEQSDERFESAGTA